MSQTKAQLLDTLVASLLPASDSSVDIGSNAVRFANIYGDTLYGNGANLTGINTDLVSDTSPQLGGNLDVNTKNILFGDSSDGASDDVLIFGAGSDLKIYHGGSNSVIAETGTGNLELQTNSSIILQKGTSEFIAKFISDGACELYYDNVKKFETRSTDCRVYDDLKLEDNLKVKLGTADDLQIYHDGTNSILTNSTGNLQIKSTSEVLLQSDASETMVRGVPNNTVELRYDNVKKFETTSTGATVTGFLGINVASPDSPLEVGGTGPSLATIHHTDGGTNDEARIMLGALSSNPPDQRGAGISARNKGAGHDLEIQTSSTHSAGPSTKMTVTAGGNVQIANDSGRLQLGASQDLELYHDGSNSYLDNSTGVLYIRGGTNSIQLRPKNDEWAVVASANGAVELAFDGSKKFETLSTGAKVTGQLNFDDGSSTANTNGIGFGSSQDCRLFHSGSAFQIRNVTGPVTCITPSHFQISADSSNDTMFKAIQDQGVELYYDNNKRFETITDGVRLTSATPQIAFHANGVNNAGQIKLSESSGGGVMRFFTKTTGGTETERARFQTGGGISFNGDTAADNALDDYEEGTWSPSGSWTTITASYTKIGRMVYAGFSLRANTNDGSNVTIGNLPFTSGSTHGHVGGIAWGLCEFNTTDSWLNGSVDDASTTVTVRRGNATVVTFGSGNNNMNQNAFIRGMIIYMTA